MYNIKNPRIKEIRVENLHQMNVINGSDENLTTVYQL